MGASVTVFPEVKFVLIAMPKCARTSLHRALGIGSSQRSVPDECFEPDWIRATVIRHPLDRLVSFWEWCINIPGRAGKVEAFGVPVSCKTFRDFVYYTAEVPDEDAHDHWQSQHSMLTMLDGQFVPNLLIKFDMLEYDWFNLVRVLLRRGLKVEVNPLMSWLPHANKSETRQHFETYYDYLSRDIAVHRYGDDLEIWHG